jgi:hypothetical protein
MRHSAFDADAMVVIIQNSDPGSRIILQRNIVGPPYQKGGNGPILPNLQNATRKFQKKIVQVWKITIFDRQTALFNGASMGAIT